MIAQHGRGRESKSAANPRARFLPDAVTRGPRGPLFRAGNADKAPMLSLQLGRKNIRRARMRQQRASSTCSCITRGLSLSARAVKSQQESVEAVLGGERPLPCFEACWLDDAGCLFRSITRHTKLSPKDQLCLGLNSMATPNAGFSDYT